MTVPGRMVRGEFRPWSPLAPGRYCLAVCYCGTCDHYTPAPTSKPSTVKTPRTTRLLDKDAWRLRFTDYVRSLPVGAQFTTAELHGKIPDPPHPNHWGGAQRHAAELGLIRAVTAQKSDLGTTKGSLVRRWERINENAQQAVA